MGYARGSMSETADHDFGHLPPAAAGLGHVFARPKVVAGLCVVVLAGLGWFYLGLLLAGTGEYLGTFGLLQALCNPLQATLWSVRDVAVVAPMWCAMTLAMMLPSAAPMVLTYAEIADTAARKAERIISPFVLTAGYATVWIGFSVVAALMQIAFMRAGLLDTGMTSASGLFSGTIFIVAGAYQFSTLKHACLTQCQRPFPFFFTNWATTRADVFRLGLKQGSYCLGCCWAMMLVMFAVGLMNIIWMAALGIVMTAEKMLTGRRFTYAVGTVLIVLGTGIVLAALGAHWSMRTNLS
jgi:predicted metal-binding membrane protein